MLTIKAVTSEQDFITMCDIESAVIKNGDYAIYTTHPSHLVADRYLYGSAQGFFTYGKLIMNGNTVIGYMLAYLVYPDETEFAVRLLPQFIDYYQAALESIETTFINKTSFSIITNHTNHALCKALLECGFVCEKETRWQSGLDLRKYKETEVVWQDEIIKPLSEADIDDRVKYAEIPTGTAITRTMYEELMSCDYYKAALDYVIRDKKTNEFIGFITWWIDENSKTATLAVAACLPTFRRRGITKRALIHTLNELKRYELQYAYVSTSIYNEKAQPLYCSVGFQKIGTTCRYLKEKLNRREERSE